MKEDIFYSDFKDIRITSKKFYAGKKTYALNKIKQIAVQRVVPQKWLGISLFIVGIFMILIGALGVLGDVKIQSGQTLWFISLDFIAIGFGILALLMTVLKMLFARDQFSVEVETTDGKHESVTSNSRKYVARLAASLKRAYYRQNAGIKKETAVSVLS